VRMVTGSLEDCCVDLDSNWELECVITERDEVV
jgi:hypothetical protein